MSPIPEFCFGWQDRWMEMQKDREMMSNTIVADQLITTKATNKYIYTYLCMYMSPCSTHLIGRKKSIETRMTDILVQLLFCL